MIETMSPLAEVDDQGETTADLDQEVALAEADVRQAEAAERAALSAAPDAHHKAADLLRWAQAKLDRLRALRDDRDAAAAEQRRQESLAEAERILTGHALADVATTYGEALAALGRLVDACERRNEAITAAARVLRRGGHDVPNPSRPVLRLSDDVWLPGDTEPGQLVMELVYETALQRRLSTLGGTAVTSITAQAVPRVSRSRVARLAGTGRGPAA